MNINLQLLELDLAHTPSSLINLHKLSNMYPMVEIYNTDDITDNDYVMVVRMESIDQSTRMTRDRSNPLYNSYISLPNMLRDNCVVLRYDKDYDVNSDSIGNTNKSFLNNQLNNGWKLFSM